MTDDASSVEAGAPAKADPETLALRAAPRRTVRFRRSAVISIAAVAATALVGTVWLALTPLSPALRETVEYRGDAAKAPSDALAGAPSGYDEVPTLGPPLPGDLGRPILHRARQEPDEIAASRGPVRATESDADTERQRIAADRRAARRSGIMMPLGDARLPTAIARPGDPGAIPAPSGGADAGARDELAGRVNGSDDINPRRLVPAASPWILQAGSVIAASLITGLNSDLPGLVTAQITENIYDSVTGRTLLVPQGSRLVGTYDRVTARGQSRALVIWQRIILPNGASIRIDDLPATDTQGYAGLSDRIERHGWQLLKGVALSTLLGVGTELSFGGTESDIVQAIRESAQLSGARAGDQIVGRSLDVPPTVRVRPGWPLRVVVHKDLVLAPWMQGEKTDG